MTVESKIDILNKNLKEVKEKFEALQKCGIDPEILEVYLKDKTHLSKKEVKEVIKHTEEFYNKLSRKFVMEKL